MSESSHLQGPTRDFPPWLPLDIVQWALNKYSYWGSDPWNVDFIGLMVGTSIFAERSLSDSNEHPGLRTIVLHNLLSLFLITPLTSSLPLFNKLQTHKSPGFFSDTPGTLPPIFVLSDTPRESLSGFQNVTSHTGTPRKLWVEESWLACNFFPLNQTPQAGPDFISLTYE